MNIFANNTITNIINKPTVQKIASQMSNHKALLPIIMLEATVISGRTYHAYKRGGETECRERAIDETLTAAVWFGVITWLNSAFSKLIKIKGLFDKKGLPEIDVDLGNDAIRNPLKEAIKNRPEIKNKVCSLKLVKILGAALAGIYLSGIVLPKFYQNLTKKMLTKEKEKEQNQQTNNKNNERITMQNFMKQTSLQKSNNISFGSATTFIHSLENNPIYKLLTVDVGLFAGRAYSARNNDERFELLFRDFCSSFFYMFSTPLIYFGLSKMFDALKGKNTDLDPKTTEYVTQYLNKQLNGNNMNIDKFKDVILGQNRNLATNILHRIDGEIVDIDKLRKIVNTVVTNSKQAQEIMKRAEKFIELRPIGSSKTFLPLSEVLNSVIGGVINEPEFLTKAVSISTDGISQNPQKFISYREIDKIKTNILHYTESIVEYAKKKGINEISSDLLTQMRNRNMICKIGYTISGLAVSSLFLSTLIPKIQYKLTEWRTGKKEFPGIRDIQKNT